MPNIANLARGRRLSDEQMMVKHIMRRKIIYFLCDNNALRVMTAALWLMALALGLVYAWSGRYFMNPDGIAYLDIADAYRRGDWGMAVNAYWSPLYSWLLAAGMVCARPTWMYEFPVVHGVNYIVYMCALGAFHYFLSGLLCYRRRQRARDSEKKYAVVPDSGVLAMGYALFVWSALTLIKIHVVSPDLCVTVFLYLAAGIVLRMRMGNVSYGMFMLLGMVLGINFLTKTSMLVLAPVFILCSMVIAGEARRAVAGGMCALIIVLAISVPFIAAISAAKGRLTIGDSGMLNYAWFVSNTSEYTARDSRFPDQGMPRPPLAALSLHPHIFAFSAPVGGTYPLWYDPSYWHEGVRIDFDIQQQLRAVGRNMKKIGYVCEGGIIACVGLVLYVIFRRRTQFFHDMAEYGCVLVPALTALAMYVLVLVEHRYIGAFLVLVGMSVCSGMRLPDGKGARRVLAVSGIVCAVLMVLPMIGGGLSKGRDMVRAIRGAPRSEDTQVYVARELKRWGVMPGDAVAYAGNAVSAYWARLARVRIIAEIPLIEPLSERVLSPEARAILASAGARYLIARIASPEEAGAADRQKLGTTDYYVYFLNK